ncbi:MAG: RdgB/HAM1 family non-canonical purine NTP pyrophosphatase [Deltaproteobacteria bacterium]|nr:RdgB/HAM1 family non-canonical purine NTP pyrophosphatase [Deltaproteobacteria bacterium]
MSAVNKIQMYHLLKSLHDHPDSRIRDFVSIDFLNLKIESTEKNDNLLNDLSDLCTDSEPDSEDISGFYDEEMLTALLEVFREEANEHLDNLLIQMNSYPLPVYDIYRTFHTIKGSAATVGLTKISGASKLLEDEFHIFADSKSIPQQDELFILGFSAVLLALMVVQGDDHVDSIRGALTLMSDAHNEEPEDKNTFTANSPIHDNSNKNAEVTVCEDTVVDEMEAILMEVFSQEAEEHLESFDTLVEELSNGNDVIHDLFRVTHTLKGAAATVGISRVSDAAHALEDFFETLEKDGGKLDKNDVLKILHAGQLLRNSLTDCSAETVQEIISTISEIDTGKKETAPLPKENRQKQTTTGSRNTTSSILRIKVDDIDKLINTSEELVLVRTQIEKSRDDFNSITGDLLLSHHTLRNFLMEDRNKMSEAERLERLSELEVEIAELIYNLEHSSSNLTTECVSLQTLARTVQQRLIALRITDFELLFIKLKQAVRELAFASDKEIEMKFTGQFVEVDKGVIDSLSSPLLQIVRNCVAHGIEPPKKRRKAGKSAGGLIKVDAIQEGHFVRIIIEDDGKGIDTEKIRNVIRKRNLVESESDIDRLKEKDLFEAIFLPGFTTKDTADSMSGRGVGLDLVREKIRKLGGDVSVKSESGTGTKFTVRVPLTTFISRALLFTIGNEVYGIPSAYCVETMEYISKKEISVGARVIWNSESIPIIPLHHYFGIERQQFLSRPYSVIILKHGEQHFGIATDSTIGIKDVTVKPIGKLLSSLRYFSGAIISGAGTIQLIFSVPFLSTLARPTIGFRASKEIQKHISTPRILVCDDSKSVREAASRIIAGAGYEVTKAQDGWEAWNILHSERFDLVLTDLEMPRMNGWELINEIKRDMFLEGVPVVVLSSRTGETSRKKAMDAGANYFVSKPIKPLILLRVLEQFVPLDDTSMSNRIVLFATTNKGKVLELNSLIAGLNLEIWGMDQFPQLEDVIEDGATFEANAIKKARIRCLQTGLPSLADDSGLEVSALNNEPGIHSARYAGENATDNQKVDFLLKKMEGITDRSARFVSVLAFCTSPESTPITVKGVCNGYIGHIPSGTNGFGYDPIFMLPKGKSMAELTMDEKNEVSHRADAMNQMLPILMKFASEENSDTH